MIHLVIPGLPLSVNHLYFWRGRKQILTTQGKKYKNEVISGLQERYRQEMMIFKKDHRYQIFFRFHCESIHNKNWKPNGKTNRYKKFDGGNFCKILEDCIAEAGGIDDSQTMCSLWKKAEVASEEPEKTEVWAWDLDVEADPFDIDFMLANLH